MSPLDDFEQAIERLYAFRTHEADEAALAAHRACLKYVWVDGSWWNRYRRQVRLTKLTNRYHKVASTLWITHYDEMNGERHVTHESFGDPPWGTQSYHR